MEFLVEPYGTGKVNFDINAIRGIGDMVMCEFWYGPTTWGWDSILPVASNAHVNGKAIVAAESFTGQPQHAWKVDLFDLKQPGDRAFCNGVNLFVLHASAHQPWPYAKPGMTMGWWGTQFGPSQTWWNHGAPQWIEYISRCQMLLQKGLFVADICFLHLSKQKDPIVPAGYKADICTPKEFLQRFNVKDNEWILPDGMSYKILVLPANSSIDIELARKIEQLIQKGGVVIGSGFKGSAGLDQLNVNDDVIRISKSLFGIPNANGKYEKAERKLGKGKVFTGYDINEVLQLQNIVKDISWPEGEQKLMWIHRRDKADQCYFISNQSNDKKVSQLSFRVFGLLPELYNPETGIMIPAPIWAIENGKTNITLSLEEYGSVFVIFRKSTIAKHGIKKLQLNSKEVNFFNFLFTKNSKNFLRLKELGNYQLFLADNKVQQKIQSKKAEIKALNSNWEVSFEENRGAPIQAKFDKLISYVDSSEKGIQYFSGKAIYRKDFFSFNW